MSEYVDALQRVIEEVVAPEAEGVDREGTFPKRSLEALAGAGILGLTASADLGGGGQGMRQAADVIQRLAGTCGSTAMVVLMHYTASAAIAAHGPQPGRDAIAAGPGRDGAPPPASTSAPWPSPRPGPAATSGRRRAQPPPMATTPSCSTPARAGSPPPGTPTATSGPAARSTPRPRAR
jgi:hypothetical protein